MVNGYFIVIILVLGVFLIWFGYEVEYGKHMPNPKDRFFLLFGRNIDYVLGVVGILAGIGMLILAFGVWARLQILNYIASAFILVGIIRAYLPPERFGPGWYRRYKRKPRLRKS